MEAGRFRMIYGLISWVKLMNRIPSLLNKNYGILKKEGILAMSHYIKASDSY
jgi:hypothetical protein